MYQIRKTFVRPESKMADLIAENPYLLLLMEHLEMEYPLRDKTVHGLCSEYRVGEDLFTALANLYNGFHLSADLSFSSEDILTVIRLLHNTHHYYKEEKYPEIRSLISGLGTLHEGEEIGLIERFFNEYFLEVMEHLDYEDEVAFPYFTSLILSDKASSMSREKAGFSVQEYREHHTDIESKLADLKHLLLKHVSLNGAPFQRRKLLFALFELEFDLIIHSLIEEVLLIPQIHALERKQIRG